MQASRPEVLIVDDHAAVRHALEYLLRGAGFAIAAGSEQHTDPRSQLRHGSYDVAMLEIRLRSGDGLELARHALAPETLTDALRMVADGGRFVDPELSPLLAAGPAEQRLAVLSRRERQVLSLLADGDSGPEIAERLFLSLETVRTHIRNAITKLGARTRVQAAAMVAAARDEPPGDA
jgi:DNA-binding NarL/FixJ family response regulator